MNANPLAPVTRLELRAELGDVCEALAKLDAEVRALQEHGAKQADLAELKAIAAGAAKQSDVQQLKERVASIEEHGAKRVDLEGFATKKDLEAFATKKDLEVFATNQALANLEIKLLDRLDTNLRWTVGTGVVLAGVIVSAVGLLITLLPRLVGS